MSETGGATPAHRAAASRPVLAGLFLLALAVRIPTLGLRRIVEGDGVHYASLARTGDLSGFADAYWSNLWPAVIALTGAATGRDVVEAGRLASLVSGSLLAPLTALLGRRLFGRASGLAAGLAVAAHPWLLHFSTLVYSESLFATLLVALLLAGGRAAGTRRMRDAAGAGLVAGLALLTRPEAFAPTLVVALWLLAGRWWTDRMAAVRNALAVVAIAGALLTARALLVHRYQGAWDFGVGAKGTANLLVGLADTPAERERLATEITPDGQNKLDLALAQWTIARFARECPGLLLAHVAKNLGRLAASSGRVLPPLPVSLGRGAFAPAVGLFLDPLAVASLAAAGLGLVAGLVDPASRSAAAVLGATIVLFYAGLSLLNVHDRLLVSLAPLLLILLSHGVVTAARRLAPAHVMTSAASLLLLAPLSLIAILRAPSLAYADDPLPQKDAGLWLRERFGQEMRIMTPSPALSFYFYDAAHQRKAMDLPWADYATLLAYARRTRTDIVAASEWYLESIAHPASQELLSPPGPHPGLEHLTTIGAERPYCVHIYRVDAEAP